MKNILARAALVACCFGVAAVQAQSDGSGGGDYHGRNNLNENDRGRGAVPGKADPMATDSVASIHITTKKKHSTRKSHGKHSGSSSSAH